MADVTFSGSIVPSSTSVGLLIGGICGYVYKSDNFNSRLNNCVNYGNVKHSGRVNKWTDIGGIAGAFYYDTVQNCINYGSIIHSGTTSSELNLGGIAGVGDGNKYINCANIGTITTNTNGNIGGIIGLVHNYASATISHCYLTSYSKYIGSTYSNIAYPESSKITSISSDGAEWLNSYATDNNLNEWTFNQNSVKITFVVHDGKGFSYSSQLTLLPEPARRGTLSCLVRERKLDRRVQN